MIGTGREVLENPEIGALYLGGAVTAANDTEHDNRIGRVNDNLAPGNGAV
jgi:hypothetical protein